MSDSVDPNTTPSLHAPLHNKGATGSRLRPTPNYRISQTLMKKLSANQTPSSLKRQPSRKNSQRQQPKQLAKKSATAPSLQRKTLNTQGAVERPIDPVPKLNDSSLASSNAYVANQPDQYDESQLQFEKAVQSAANAFNPQQVRTYYHISLMESNQSH